MPEPREPYWRPLQAAGIFLASAAVTVFLALAVSGRLARMPVTPQGSGTQPEFSWLPASSAVPSEDDRPRTSRSPREPQAPTESVNSAVTTGEASAPRGIVNRAGASKMQPGGGGSGEQQTGTQPGQSATPGSGQNGGITPVPMTEDTRRRAPPPIRPEEQAGEGTTTTQIVGGIGVPGVPGGNATTPGGGSRSASGTTEGGSEATSVPAGSGNQSGPTTTGGADGERAGPPDLAPQETNPEVADLGSNEPPIDPAVDPTEEPLEDPIPARATLYLVLPEQGLAPGEQVYAYLELDAGTEAVVAYGLQFFYDKNQLEVLDVAEMAGGFETPSAIVKNDLGFALINAQDKEHPRVGRFGVAQLLLQVKATGTTDLVLSAVAVLQAFRGTDVERINAVDFLVQGRARVIGQ